MSYGDKKSRLIKCEAATEMPGEEKLLNHSRVLEISPFSGVFYVIGVGQKTDRTRSKSPLSLVLSVTVHAAVNYR